MPKFLAIFYICSFITVIFLTVSFATLSKSDRKSHKNEKKNTKSDVQSANDVSYKENSIAKKAISSQDIIDEHKSYSVSKAITKNFDHEVLAYVTPWNNHGYDIAKLFAAKFTMISPVWLQMKPKDNKGAVLIEGLHDIDENWMSTLRQHNKKLKIVPRIILEQWTYPLLKPLLKEKAATDDANAELVNLAKKKSFDGYVIEIWSLLGGQMKMELTKFLVRLANLLQHHGLSLILVIPPPSYSGGETGMFNRQDFENLVDHITAFSLMSYDYSSRQRSGPNSPLNWLLHCVEDLIPDKSSPNRKKLLLGLNFYGYDYSSGSGKPIVGHEYIGVLEKHNPKLVFHNNSGEHSLTYWSENVKHEVFFPTLYSISIRMQLAKELKTGLAIWEIGQGLDYFYNLL